MTKFIFDCGIYVHAGYLKQKDIIDIILQTTQFELIDSSYFSIKTPTFLLTIRDNDAGFCPSWYIENDFNSFYFDFMISYIPLNEDAGISEEEFVKMHAKNISPILEGLWSHKIPAATSSYCNELLPLEGGNDQDKIFWVDELKVKKPNTDLNNL